MSEQPSEERDSSPVISSPKPTTTTAAAAAAATASAQPEITSKQRIQQLRERLAQYNVSIAENLASTGTTATAAATGSNANATTTAKSAAASAPPRVEVPLSPSSPTHRLARSLANEFQQSAASPPPPPPPPPPSAAHVHSPLRRTSEPAFSAPRAGDAHSPSSPSSPLRHAPQPINPKMMNDITANAAAAAASNAAAQQSTAAQSPKLGSASPLRASSVSNPFQSGQADIRHPRQRASVDMMEEAVRRSSTVSAEAAMRAAQQDATMPNNSTTNNFASSSSPVRSPFLSQRTSLSAQRSSVFTGASAPFAVPSRQPHASPSSLRLHSSSEEEEDEDDESQYEEFEFEVEEIEEEYEETETSEETSSYDEEDDESVDAFLQELLSTDAFVRDAVGKTLSQQPGHTDQNGTTMNPLIRRAAELYRQRRREQQQHQKQPSQHRDPASPDATPATRTTSTTSSSPSLAVSTGAFSPESVAEAVAGGAKVRFGQLETAYCHMIAAQLGAEKLQSKVSLKIFPPTLPMLSATAIMVARRDELTKSIQELCRTPATSRALLSVREEEGQAMDAKCRAFLQTCQAHIRAKPLKVVEDQQAIVLGKERLLAQRQKDLEERRVACRAVREEMLKMKRRNATRSAQLGAREATHSRRLEEHTALEASTQARIAEVEQLGKKVSWWLRVLEERNTALTQKEERLHHMEADVARRRGDLKVLKGSQSRSAKYPPPPPPPRGNMGA